MKVVERALESNDFKLALDGTTWRAIYENFPDLVPKICKHGVVFARMTIGQKRQLIIELMQLGYQVGTPRKSNPFLFQKYSNYVV